MSVHIQAGLPYPSQPRLLYSSLLHAAGAVFSSGGTVSGYPAENLARWEPWREWRGSHATSVEFSVDLGSAQSANTLALLGENISGKLITVYRSDNGSAWTAIDGYLPTDDSTLWKAFLGDSARYWRVTFAGNSLAAPVIIRAAALGVALDIPSGLRPGAAAPPLLPEWQAETQESYGGALLGRSVQRMPWEADIALPSIEDSWALANLPGLLDHLETKPAFWCPDATLWPWASLAYLREPAAITYSQAGNVDLALPLAGVAR